MRVLNVTSPAVLGTAILMVMGTTACATKKHVRQVVAPVETRVAGVEKKTTEQASAIGELENSVSRTDERAMEADRKAAAAGQAADRANQAADTANKAALEARSRADSANQVAEQTRARLGEVVENIDNYKLAGTEAVLFPFNRWTLTKEAKEQLDAAIAKLKDSKGYLLEIQGFTDATGSKNTNLSIAQKRADAVVRYLTVEHNVPLRKINVLGVGEENFAADNKTRAGRKQNRRVEMKVFALDLGGPAQSGTQASAPPPANP